MFVALVKLESRPSGQSGRRVPRDRVGRFALISLEEIHHGKRIKRRWRGPRCWLKQKFSGGAIKEGSAYAIAADEKLITRHAAVHPR